MVSESDEKELKGRTGQTPQLTPREIMLALIHAGWLEEGVDTLEQAFRIAFMESSHKPKESMDYKHDESYGLFQITPRHHQERLINNFGNDYYVNLEDNILDPVNNARVALQIYRDNKRRYEDEDGNPDGWRLWTSNLHLNQLDDPNIVHDDPQLPINIRNNYAEANRRLKEVWESDPKTPTPPTDPPIDLETPMPSIQPQGVTRGIKRRRMKQQPRFKSNQFRPPIGEFN